MHFLLNWYIFLFLKKLLHMSFGRILLLLLEGSDLITEVSDVSLPYEDLGKVWLEAEATANRTESGGL